MSTTASDARATVAQRAQNAGQVQKGGKQQLTLAQQIERQKPEMARVLPAHMDADRMARIALTLLRKTPKLAECSAESFLGALMTCSQLGMEPGPTGEAFIIPYKGEAEFQLGYQGMITLFHRHPLAASVKAVTVYEKDYFEHEEGLDEKLVHKPFRGGPRGAAIAYYTVARLTNGAKTFQVMYPSDIESRRKKSRSPNSIGWSGSYDEMAKKTVLRNHFKTLPKSTVLAEALALDETVRTDPAPTAIDDVPPYVPPAIEAGEVVDVEMEPEGGWGEER